ncbi:Rrf2 family transcriptional regulator [bacterium]|nr:Rrf2 family transcriptional regulator [bacterium]
MKISTKGRYALRMLIDLAKHQNEGFITLKDIAKRQEISKKYLEQIVVLLNPSKILQANRGFQGGYKLAVNPKNITVASILKITEGSINPVSCLDNEPNICERCHECSTLPVWEGLSKVINDYLEGISIQDIIDKQNEKFTDNYVI